MHHKLPAEPNCSHSTRQSIHSRQLKSNFHSIRLAPDCELGERGRRATFSWPKPHATEAERPCAYGAVRVRRRTRTAALHRPQRCVATAMAQLSQGSLARAQSRRRSWQQQRFDGSLGAGGHCSRGAEAVRRAKGQAVPERTGHWPSLDAPWPGLGTESRPAGQDWAGTGTECLGCRTDSSRTQSPVPIRKSPSTPQKFRFGRLGREESPVCTTFFGNL